MKLILKILMLLLLLVILAVAFVVMFLDPNVFKPRIEKLAAQQGVHLDIEGDLAWKFWPSLGIAINDITVASTQTPDEPLASLRSASLLVATKPLFSGELQVEHLLVDGAELTLTADESGSKNWQRFTAQERQAAAEMSEEQLRELKAQQKAQTPSGAEGSDPSDAQSGRSLSLAVEQISITDSELNYSDESAGQQVHAALHKVELTGFNLTDQPFELNAEANLSLESASAPDGVIPLAIDLSAIMQVNENIDQFQLSDGQLRLGVGHDDVALVSDFSASAQDMQGDMSYGASFALQTFNLKELLASLGMAAPQTANPDALSQVSLSTKLIGSANTLALSPIEASVDQTHLNGELSITDLSTQALQLTLVGDFINIDDYLPPPAPQTDSKSSNPVSGTSGGKSKPQVQEEPLPLDAIRALNANVQFDFAKAIVNKLTVENMRLRLSAKNGVMQLTEASLNSYQGQLQAQGQLDARGRRAKASFTADMTGVQLEPLLEDLQLEQDIQLTGALNVKAKGNTSGAFASDLFKQLNAEASISGVEVTVAPLNVEKYFCRIVALTKDEAESADGKTSEQRSWPEFTQMSALDGTIRLNNQVVTVENFEAGVDQLLLATQGQLNLAAETYDFRLPLTLLEKTTSAEGCTVKSNYWLNRSLSLLRCKGSLDNLSPLKDCGLDSKALESLTGDYAKYKLQKELTRKLGGDTEGGEKDDKTKAVEGILNRLLNQDKQ
ncbi:AsmA family protein [Gilvimarinus sp. DA14]|uniref:AsmA family protein n=1 Tax=Gilvimarinus sp. DA14 TaxID=2956798 RepID=UPI0020B8C0CB|nr:AsmA family protein [Gilvimarinus sp. DA14]UTF61712.1 AsmA family protein [Gilvimarinus sp. DA14]